jgi:hypothetical protein
MGRQITLLRSADGEVRKVMVKGFDMDADSKALEGLAQWVRGERHVMVLDDDVDVVIAES